MKWSLPSQFFHAAVKIAYQSISFVLERCGVLHYWKYRNVSSCTSLWFHISLVWMLSAHLLYVVNVFDFTDCGS